MATAIAAILVLRDGSVTPADMVAVTLEIIGMAGCAERCVLGPPPRDIAGDGIAVAGGATGVTPVVARVVPVGIMIEIGRRPAVGRVADIALLGGR